MKFEERRWTSADGLTLYARDYAAPGAEAERLPVICLHGLTRNARDFEDVAPWIAARGRRVIVPDVRGRGRSDWAEDANRYLLQVYALDVVAMMRRLAIPRAVFVGTSMGGLVTMMLAAFHSRMIGGAVLNDIGPELEAAGVRRIMSYAGRQGTIADWSEAAEAAKAVNVAAFPDYGDGEWQAFARRTFRESERGIAADYNPAIMQPIMSGRYYVAPRLLWRLFRKLARSCPTLLVRGGISDLLSPAIAAKMRSQALGLEVVEVPGVGHAPMLTEPAAREALAGFLDRVS